ncbi:DUF4041 domain-containing protein [Lactococcus carnosus]|nr:DUF4041 domain-containing protein [Lactococcus carnosus]
MGIFKNIRNLSTLNEDITIAETILLNLKKENYSLDSEVKINSELLNNQTNMLAKFKDNFEKENETVRLKMISDTKKECNEIKEKSSQELQETVNRIKTIQVEKYKLEVQILSLEKQVVDLKDQIEMESFGFYKPKYDFASSLAYKAQLTSLINEQKNMVKNKTAVSYSDNWTVNGSIAEGRKMTNNNIKQILRSFNNECEAAINKVKYNNLKIIEKRILKAYEQLNKLNESNGVSISPKYLDLKTQEMFLAYEYENKKQNEKEELREQREKEREEKALQREIDSQKKIIDKDIKHYKNIINELKEKILNLENQSEINDVNDQINELVAKVSEKQSEKEELDYRNAHASAGYVYIISNIGAFGKDVVKIGVTRRLEPLDRINELSSASVPFKYDVHALVFSYDAYKLEKELHDYFGKYRVNKVNNRKEFFKVSITEIEEKLKDYKELTIDFTSQPEADEYRQTMSLSSKN